MQLLVLILKKVDLMDEIIKQLGEARITGGTILEGTGMAKALMNMEDLPIFGVLRHVLAEDELEVCKVMMSVLTKESVAKAKEIIKNVVGDFTQPNTGIMFAIELAFVEGIGE